MYKRIAFALFFFIPFTSQAKLFRNAYVSFELPNNWNCTLEGTEWTCSSQLAKDGKEAMIILSAKERGPNDTLQAYELAVKGARPLPNKAGVVIPSKVVNVGMKRINDHDWVDAMHLGSEVTTYYTRYLATVKGTIGILVTFSAHQQLYTKYSADFIKAIQSLRVVAPNTAPDPAQTLGQGSIPESTGLIGDSSGAAGLVSPEQFEDEPTGGISEKMKNVLALMAIVAAVGLYLILTRGKKRKKK